MPRARAHTKNMYYACNQCFFFSSAHNHIHSVVSNLLLVENSVFILWVMQLLAHSLSVTHMAFRELSSVSLLSSPPSLPHLSVLYGFADQLIPTILFSPPIQLQSSLTCPFQLHKRVMAQKKNWLAQSPQLSGPLSSPLLHQPLCTLPLCPPFYPLLNCSTSPPSIPPDLPHRWVDRRQQPLHV